MIAHPHYPIIYLRGYAGSQAEVEETVATPYMGFNLGSTKVRQLWDGRTARLIFESPLLRLMKDHQYRDVYDQGAEIPVEKKLPPRSVWIYRYYEDASEDLGPGKRRGIEDYARGLADLMRKVRDRYCGGDRNARDAFRVYLVAHSMGGLIVRCLLQNVGTDDDVRMVEKVYTYATPHGGIDFRLVGNVPSFITRNNVDNFNETRMREYLKLGDDTDVRTLTRFDPQRFFCLVGTNHRDYEAVYGLSSKAVGEMSDGLVTIKNAYVIGAPRAFVHRAHSGHYGVVNSESGYQNLRRFLFGDVRVDAYLDVHEVTLPRRVQTAKNEGKKVRASYHIETVTRVRGALWDLHRRTVGEESAIFKGYDDLVKPGRRVHLASAYLLRDARVQPKRTSLGYSLDLRIAVPEYEVDNKWWLDDHYEGSALFQDKFNLEAILREGREPVLRWGTDRTSTNIGSANRPAEITVRDADRKQYEFRIPVLSRQKPGIRADLYIATAVLS